MQHGLSPLMQERNKVLDAMLNVRIGKTMMGNRIASRIDLYAVGLRGATFFLLLACSVSLRGQNLDSFEGGEPRLLLVESDCQAQLTEHEISLTMPHGGRTSEMMEVACSAGSRALVAYPIQPSLVLNEFEPRVWVRCSSGQIQIGVRVVFPLDKHPVTGGRLTSILWGDRYDTPGQWQVLHLAQLERLLGDEVVRLRQLLGADLKLDGAVIDGVVLNVYTGPGRYRVQVDDLELRGLVPLSATGVPVPRDWRARWRWREKVPSAEQTFWATANMAPVWIQHSGESYPWLESLGYTGVWMNQLPTEQQLASINQADLDVICPPPPQGVVFAKRDAAAIKGWLVGAALDANQLDSARTQAKLASSLPEELARPLVGEVLERHWQFARIADEVLVPLPHASAPGAWRGKQEWLSEKLSVLRPGAQGWASVSLDPGPALTGQYVSLANVLEPDSTSVPQLVSPLATRHQAVSAVVAGARGILMRGSEPLVDGDQAQHANIAAVRWTNSDMRLWGPWLAQGKMQPTPITDRPGFHAAVWAVRDSRLVVATVASAESGHCLPATGNAPLTLALPRSATAQQVLRLTHDRLETVPVEQTHSGLTWTVENPREVESFVVTSNPAVMAYLARRLESAVLSNATDRLDIARYNLDQASRLIDARFEAGTDDRMRMQAARPHLENLARAKRLIGRADQAMRSRDPQGGAERAADALDAIQSVFWDSYQAATRNLASPQASPYVLSPNTLYLHWQLAAACDRSTWRDVDLPGARFANLNGMLSDGWTQQRRDTEDVDLRVELVPQSSSTGAGLRLAAYQRPLSNQSVEGGYEGALLRVRSASAQVPGGHLVRVAAKAHVIHAVDRPDCGVLVYDNQAGPSLGQLVRGKAGDVVDVELYRMMVEPGEFRILAECRGECDVVLKELRLSIIKPATNRVGYTTSPLSIEPSVPVGTQSVPELLQVPQR